MGRLASLSVRVVGSKWGVVVQRWASLESSCVPLKEGLGSSMWDSVGLGGTERQGRKQATSKGTVSLECQHAGDWGLQVKTNQTPDAMGDPRGNECLRDQAVII